MSHSIQNSLSFHFHLTRRRLVLFSPFLVVVLGQLAARTVGPIVGDWGWLPLNIGYWITLALLIVWGGGRQAILNWLRRPQGHWLWPLLAFSIAIVPTAPMLFPDTWRLFLRAEIWLPTLLFVLVNPCVEEGYWRGLLLDAAGDRSKWWVILYASTLFMLNHLWISVMVIGARNPMASAFQFVFGMVMSITYLKTRSLRWPMVAHFLANLLTPTIAVFLNLYIPGIPR